MNKIEVQAQKPLRKNWVYFKRESGKTSRISEAVFICLCTSNSAEVTVHAPLYETEAEL